MAINLSRNTKLFVSTVKDTDATGHSVSTTYEIPILDGYNFTQEADTQVITLNEAGDLPSRGQKIFNTAINPADVTFSTYVRPYHDTTNHDCVEKILWEALVGDGTPPGSSTAAVGTNAKPDTTEFQANFEQSNKHELLKLYLFFQVDNAVYRLNEYAITSAEVDFSIDGIAMINWTGQATTVEELGTTGDAIRTEFDAWVADTDYEEAENIAQGGTTNALFIKNKLSTISLVGTSDDVEAQWTTNHSGGLVATDTDGMDGASTYTVDVTIDGGSLQSVSIDSSGAPWTDAGITVADVIDEMNYQLEDCTVAIDNTGDLIVTSLTAGTVSTVLVAVGTTDLLEVISSQQGLTAVGTESTDGAGTPKTYSIPITGGTLTIENNVTFLVPEELGRVNQSIGSFTGTRAIGGTLTAYLNTGTNKSGGLLADLVGDTTTITHDFEMTLAMGGGANTPRVEFIMPNTHIVIPSINVEDVVSTEINFTALGTSLTDADELTVRYYAQ